MIILDKPPFKLKNTAVCIGKFDGLHEGHKLLADSLNQEGLTKVMFTFDFPEHKQQIYSEEEKEFLAHETGFDIMIKCPFDKNLIHMKAEDFIKEYLVEQCDSKLISVGEDFHFGYERKGDVSLLKQFGKTYGYSLYVFKKKKKYNHIISSTDIREYITDSNLEIANELLGRPYFIMGKVIYGNQIGRTLDMPTANLSVSPYKVLPKFGVYATKVYIEDQCYIGVTNIGKKPTIPGENQVGIETNIIDFSGNIYGKQILVEFYSFIRDEMKFSGLEELKAQMENDRNHAIQFFS